MTLYDLSKRIFDFIVSLALIILFSVPMLLLALVVKLTSPGPICYNAKRMGRGGKPFVLYKFRSMLHNAPPVKNTDGSYFVGDDDPRVTKIGRLMRKTSLDELPQLFNVLKGDMSLVGPRPDPLDTLEMYRPQDHKRLEVLPGMTGLAAIKGRNDNVWEVRRDLDLEYVEIRSFWVDLKILVMTAPAVLASRGIDAKRY